jgi:hypothetical protein
MLGVLQLCKHNQDIKLILNGTETKDVTWYFSSYVAKNQWDISNSSVLLANWLAFHEKQEHYNGETTTRNKRLIQRCVNTLSREQMFSAPGVISYLMGNGDCKISHYFASFYTLDLSNALRKARTL